MERTHRRRPTRAETRTRILRAAVVVFGERGIAATSLSEVAAAAGLTKGAVYSNFDSKDDLVLAMMEEHVMARVTAGLVSADSEHPHDAHALMTQLGSTLVRAMHEDAAWHRLLAEYFAMAHRDERVALALRDRRREARGAAERALVRVCESLRITLPLPPAEMAVVLFALSNGLAVESGIDPEGVPDHLFGTVLGLLAPEAARAISAAPSTPPSDAG